MNPEHISDKECTVKTCQGLECHITTLTIEECLEEIKLGISRNEDYIAFYTSELEETERLIQAEEAKDKDTPDLKKTKEANTPQEVAEENLSSILSDIREIYKILLHERKEEIIGYLSAVNKNQEYLLEMAKSMGIKI